MDETVLNNKSCFCDWEVTTFELEKKELIFDRRLDYFYEKEGIVFRTGKKLMLGGKKEQYRHRQRIIYRPEKNHISEWE